MCHVRRTRRSRSVRHSDTRSTARASLLSILLKLSVDTTKKRWFLKNNLIEITVKSNNEYTVEKNLNDKKKTIESQIPIVESTLRFLSKSSKTLFDSVDVAVLGKE